MSHLENTRRCELVELQNFDIPPKKLKQFLGERIRRRKKKKQSFKIKFILKQISHVLDYFLFTKADGSET